MAITDSSCAVQFALRVNGREWMEQFLDPPNTGHRMLSDFLRDLPQAAHAASRNPVLMRQPGEHHLCIACMRVIAQVIFAVLLCAARSLALRGCVYHIVAEVTLGCVLCACCLRALRGCVYCITALTTLIVWLCVVVWSRIA